MPEVETHAGRTPAYGRREAQKGLLALGESLTKCAFYLFMFVQFSLRVGTAVLPASHWNSGLSCQALGE